MTDLKVYREPDRPRTFRVFVLTCFAVVAFLLLVAAAARADSGVWRLPVDRVCAVEVSHVYDGDGGKTLSQTCYLDFYAWLPEPRYYYRAWRQLRTPSMIPVRDYQRGGYVAIWVDGDQLRIVRCLSVYETHLQFDPEIAERPIHPLDNRRELFQRFDLPKVSE